MFEKNKKSVSLLFYNTLYLLTNLSWYTSSFPVKLYRLSVARAAFCLVLSEKQSNWCVVDPSSYFHNLSMNDSAYHSLYYCRNCISQTTVPLYCCRSQGLSLYKDGWYVVIIISILMQVWPKFPNIYFIKGYLHSLPPPLKNWLIVY